MLCECWTQQSDRNVAGGFDFDVNRRLDSSRCGAPRSRQRLLPLRRWQRWAIRRPTREEALQLCVISYMYVGWLFVALQQVTAVRAPYHKETCGLMHNWCKYNST